MPAPLLTLISHPLCPFVQRVAIALQEKNLPFARVDIDLRDKPDWFLAISPTGKVPLLKIDQGDASTAILFESIAICEYIEDVHPAPALHPRDPIQRAQHRAWIDFASGMLGDAWGLLNAASEKIADARVAVLRQKLERVEAELPPGPYFAGAAFSMVDAAVAPMLRYFDIVAHARLARLFDGLGKVDAWRHALAARPSVKAAVSDNYAARFHAHLDEQKSIFAGAGMWSAP